MIGHLKPRRLDDLNRPGRKPILFVLRWHGSLRQPTKSIDYVTQFMVYETSEQKLRYSMDMLTSTLYRFLDKSETPRPSHCIFVLAGRHERKLYGIELWRRGFSPQLILSVGRFEWRNFYSLGLPSDGGLGALVETIPPKARHFFVHLRKSGAIATPVTKELFGTATEASGLADYLHGDSVQTLMVVSSAIHLKRAALAFHRSFRNTKIHLNFVAVPEDPSSVSPKDLWTELQKYLLYRIFLPDYWALMR